MRIDILTLFPEMCESVLSESIIGRAREKNAVEIHCRQIRDYSKDKHNRVDDAPYGGGMGMIMQPQPIYDCFTALCEEIGERPYLVYMSPQGKTLTQGKVKELSTLSHLAILCGHYEGVDERVLEEIVDEEISVGDYVLTGGELPALIVADSVARMLPGVLSDEACFTDESHFSGLLEYPQYTRPPVWHERAVPEVLLSGNHKNIDRFRRKKAFERTLKKRPEMLDRFVPEKEDEKLLEEMCMEISQKQE
ncbi:MAG: tRNA (guanosine(37)-N1)-methyltransferase TrmD [Oscillospiraceae bacterium]|nr:tRNA (guanosine(37)-N1)-methyltransferase TrmD [Oscillospiraceae bacterium]